VRGVLSTFPLVLVLDPALAVEARYERESSLPPRECESVVRYVCDGMGEHVIEMN
jgi:hypothetical protein